LVQLILKSHKYHLTIVSNGKQAVDAVKNNRFDLILMDCQMPTMDGYEATKIIRKTHSTPIIALTAHANDENIEECLAAGMNSYLCKPYRQAQLVQIVEKFLGKPEPDET